MVHRLASQHRLDHSDFLQLVGPRRLYLASQVAAHAVLQSHVRHCDSALVMLQHLAEERFRGIRAGGGCHLRVHVGRGRTIQLSSLLVRRAVLQELANRFDLLALFLDRHAGHFSNIGARAELENDLRHLDSPLVVGDHLSCPAITKVGADRCHHRVVHPLLGYGVGIDHVVCRGCGIGAFARRLIARRTAGGKRGGGDQSKKRASDSQHVLPFASRSSLNSPVHMVHAVHQRTAEPALNDDCGGDYDQSRHHHAAILVGLSPRPGRERGTQHADDGSEPAMNGQERIRVHPGRIEPPEKRRQRSKRPACNDKKLHRRAERRPSTTYDGGEQCRREEGEWKVNDDRVKPPKPVKKAGQE